MLSAGWAAAQCRRAGDPDANAGAAHHPVCHAARRRQRASPGGDPNATTHFPDAGSDRHACAQPTPTAATTTQGYRQYGLVEFELPTIGISEQASVIAEFTGPDGSSVTLPGFWMQPQRQTCSQDCAVELIDPVGEPVWRIRFSPALPGRYTYRVDVADGGETRTAAQGTFAVEEAAGGAIRVGENPRYFERADGSPFFPVGVNLGWSWTGGRGTRGYQDWLRRLAEVGANYARLYVDVPWFIGLGWREPINSAAGFQADAWRLDTIIQTAEQYGIALQVVLVWHQGWSAYAGLPVIPPTDPARPNIAADWFSNPHNVQVGGPFQSAAEYFFDPGGPRSVQGASTIHCLALGIQRQCLCLGSGRSGRPHRARGPGDHHRLAAGDGRLLATDRSLSPSDNVAVCAIASALACSIRWCWISVRCVFTSGCPSSRRVTRCSMR